MTILSIDQDERRPGELSDYSASGGEVLKASFDEAVADNPLSKIFQSLSSEVYNVEENKRMLKGGRDPERRFSKREAEAMAKEQGVSLHEAPDNMLKSQIDLLVERQYQKKKREETINSNHDFINGSFTGSLAGSLTDPIGVAVGFIPFVGEARYAALLEKAGASALARAGVRMGVGAVEGAAGTALLEPVSYTLSKELGDDYSAANSLMNISMGGVMGGGLHMGIGALADSAMKFKKKYGVEPPADFNSSEPRPGLPEKINEMTPEARNDLAKATIAQVLEGKEINVDPVAALHENKGAPDFDPTAEVEKLNAKNGESPNSELINEKRIKEHEEATTASREKDLDPTDHDAHLALETERMNEAMANLDQQRKAMGLEAPESLAKYDEALKLADEHEKAVKIMTICALRGEK